jgi:hypothetical protein
MQVRPATRTQETAMSGTGERARIDEHVDYEPMYLAQGGLLRIENGCGMLIEVHEGLAWLTQEGEGCDLAVPAQTPYRLDRNGVAIATALQDCVVRLLRPVPQGPALRIVVRRTKGSDPVVVYESVPRGPASFVALADWWRKHASRWVRPAGPATVRRALTGRRLQARALAVLDCRSRAEAVSKAADLAVLASRT